MQYEALQIWFTTPPIKYFAFLTVYSDTIFKENIAFKIWDASQGKVIVATMNANTTSF
jgi:choline kinase